MPVTALSIEIAVADPERSITFWRDTLGFALAARQPEEGAPAWARMTSGAATIDLVRQSDSIRTADVAKPAGMTIVLTADDMPGAWISFREAGIAEGWLEITNEAILRARVNDPDGRTVVLEQPAASAPMSRERLLALVAYEWDRFLATVARVPGRRLDEPGVRGEWSGKDILAHVAAWEARALHLVDSGFAGRTPDLLGWSDIDQYNAEIWRRNREKSLDEVREVARRAHGELVARIAAATDDDLARLDRVPWLGGAPAWTVVAYNTFDHYPRHARRIEEWLAR